MTDPERRKKAEALFQEAFDLPPAEREEFLRQRCGTDAELRAEVEALLACDEADNEGFLSNPALAPTVDAPRVAVDPVPQQIGRYTVIREIGRGGMGTVYLATHGQEQFKRRVALKVLRKGVDTGDVLRRFELERQLLAALSHPNIARLLDAGETDDGCPYFAMEYVDGRPIDEHCDAEGLPIQERLRLFQKVCSAVQFAHQNLIVHRDLKPGNILIGADGEPKLLDFGIAKLLNPDLFQVTLATGPELRLMTPEYASPEQVRGERISTASDVYALGVLLYELLSGHRPYRFVTRVQHEIVRVINEVEPEKPSTVITQVEDVERRDGTTIHVTPESVARARGGHPQKLRRVLAGDLDNIVLKAMQKLPRRRYDSALQLAEDLQRHLDGLPVAARPDSRSYRLWKFVRRNRTSVSAALIVFLALAVGIAGTTWQWRIAEEQRRIADAARADAEQRAEQFAGLVDALIDDMESGLRSVEGSTAARKLLAETALRTAEQFHQRGGDHPAVRRRLAKVYLRVGETLSEIKSESGDSADRAMENYEHARELLKQLAAEAPDDTEIQLDLARSEISAGKLFGQLGDSQAAMRCYKQASDILRRVASSKLDNRRALVLLAQALDGVGDLHLGMRETDDAIQCYGEAKAARIELVDASPSDIALLRRLSVSHNKLGKAHEDAGDFSAALAEYTEALAIRQRIHRDKSSGQSRQDLAHQHLRIGGVFRLQGRLSEAASELKEAQGLTLALYEADPINIRILLDVVRVELDLGKLHQDLSQPAQAIEVYSAALGRARSASREQLSGKIMAQSLFYVAKASAGLAESVCMSDAMGALPRFEDAVQAYRETLKSSPGNLLIEGELAGLVSEYAAALRAAGRQDESITQYKESLSMFDRLRNRGPLSNEARKQFESATTALAEIEAGNQ